MMFKFLLKVPTGVTSAFFMLVVLYLCLAPQPVQGGGLLYFPGADKVVHFLMFFAIAASFIFDCSKGDLPRLPGMGRVVAATVAAVVLGGVVEVAQGLMGLGRSADIFDLLADAAGAVCAAVLMRLCVLKMLQRNAAP